jgi:hypothetical protein
MPPVCEPCRSSSLLFVEIPKAICTDHFESLLPWNITLASAH